MKLQAQIEERKILATKIEYTKKIYSQSTHILSNKEDLDLLDKKITMTDDRGEIVTDDDDGAGSERRGVIKNRRTAISDEKRDKAGNVITALSAINTSILPLR